MARPTPKDKDYDKSDKMLPVRCRLIERDHWVKVFGEGKVSALARLFLNAEANAQAQNKSLLTSEVLGFVNPDDLFFYQAQLKPA